MLIFGFFQNPHKISLVLSFVERMKKEFPNSPVLVPLENQWEVLATSKLPLNIL
jgi:hypothetical protein